MEDDVLLTIPTSYGKKFSSNAVITRGLDGCLFLFTEKGWNEMLQKFDEVRSRHKMIENQIRFVQLMIEGAIEIEVKRDGKILIPAYLKKYAKIKDEVVFVDFKSRLEIWAAEELKKRGGILKHRALKLGIV